MLRKIFWSIFLDKFELVRRIEEFAPVETQDDWDMSGWLVCTTERQVSKIMLALTVTEDVYEQAKSQSCDIIISHHPLFMVPLRYADIDIYCAHTNLDKAIGGTTDTLVDALGFEVSEVVDEYVRIVELDDETGLDELTRRLRLVSPHLRYVNNSDISKVKTIGFCAGSGSEFVDRVNVDAFITGDLKFHNSIEYKNVVYDIGHFESEVLVLKTLERVLGIEVVYAKEASPFKY